MKTLRQIISNIYEVTVIDETAMAHINLLYEAKVEKTEAHQKHEKESKKLKHLQHLEDLMVIGGHHGFDEVTAALGKTHDFLQGKRRDGFSIQTKFDGSPSIVWGHHPDTKKFFVGTKSFFNKVPKINYSDKDIDANHSASPRLADKLKFLLPHLKEVSPKEGIFQGDIMYTGQDMSSDDKNISFTPNTLTYNVEKNSTEGQKILKSKIGIAAHTHYEKQPNGEMRAVFDIDMSKFKPSDDVHFLPSKLRGPFNYKSKDISKFVESLRSAQVMNSKLQKNSSFEAIKNHEVPLMAYINSAIRNKQQKSVEGYVSFLHSQFKKKSEHLKLDKTIGSHKTVLDNEVKNIIANKKAFNDIFTAHSHIQAAKNTLIDVLSRNSPYKETILGNPSKPEGFVVSVNGKPIKLVDREHFSAANFDFNTRANPADNPLVLSFGRMNPPTTGHGKMIEKGADIARRIGAKQQVIASRSHDPEKNPLSPTQKISWLKSMFPGKNIAIAGEDKPTLIAQLQHAHNTGVKDITMVVGADRVHEFQHILAKYNGPGVGKLFNFRRARVISAGERDPDSESVTGMSASKMRKAAASDDFQTFRTGVPAHIKDSEAQEMYHQLRAEMGVVKINQTTPGHSLAIYAKRDDKIGADAKNEINRRKQRGLWTGT